MPSPFPGMDPWLEDAANWPDVHLQLISVARELLNERLGEAYFARVEERVYVSDESDGGREFHVADVKVHPTGANGRPHGFGPASHAVAEPIIATTLLDDEIHEPFIQILDRRDRSVVAVVELLSPSNKRAGSQGLRIYRQKRQEVMRSDSHLVEIDLLREGVRIPIREAIASSEYLVHVSHAAERPKGRLWPVQLVDPLPSIAVPLRGDDGDCPLDLQSMLKLAYDRAQYHRDLNYRESPRPPLPEAAERWADERLRQVGLR